MRPRRTVNSNSVFKLQGGTEDNDLWVQRDKLDGIEDVIISTWVPSDDERQRIANGENVDLIVWGHGHPPVAMRVTDVALRGVPRE
ncbi:MAG: hypothetical protein QOJ29_3447 [Thermoleophilaceae bacterium]|jgi:predicted phosphodiesterase|nr:hypothetical protein [Thermoleophilaceae bacterium]